MTDRTQCCMCDIWIDAPFGSVCADCAKPQPSLPTAGGIAWTGPVWSTKASPVADLTATIEQFRKDNPPPEPFTMRQFGQAIQAAKSLGIRPEDLLRALGQYPLPEMDRLSVITEPDMPPNEMRWITGADVPVITRLAAEESEEDFKARVLSGKHYSKITILP